MFRGCIGHNSEYVIRIMPHADKPLLYACSGCSSAAQMANHLAVKLDRSGAAEMSCIAGVGGDVPSLVARARSGRPVAVVDGCALRCAFHCLRRHQVTPALHLVLGEHGVAKVQHGDFDPGQAAGLEARLREELEGLAARAGPGRATA